MKLGKNKNSDHASAAFTLVEMLVALGISGILLASMVGTFITFAVGARSVSAYTDMSRDSRTILEYFARDMRAAEDVHVATATTIVVEYPESLMYDGGTVTYEYLGESLFRVEVDKDGTEISNEMLLDGVERFLFSYYDPLGSSLSLSTPSILLSVKSVQIDAEMLRTVSRTEATDYIISARFMMRNRPVTE